MFMPISSVVKENIQKNDLWFGVYNICSISFDLYIVHAITIGF